LTISTLCKQGHFSEALGVLGITGKRLDCAMYICLLQGCIQRNSLPEGKVIHAHIKQSGFTEAAIRTVGAAILTVVGKRFFLPPFCLMILSPKLTSRSSVYFKSLICFPYGVLLDTGSLRWHSLASLFGREDCGGGNKWQ
jgi:hypothetical protein